MQYATILELTGPSYRADAARKRNESALQPDDNHATTTKKADDNCPTTIAQEVPAENPDPKPEIDPEDKSHDGAK